MSWLAAKTPSTLRRLLIVGLVALAELGVVAVAMSSTVGSFEEVPSIMQVFLQPGAANGELNLISVFFFWLPLLAQAIYVWLARKPRVLVGAFVSAGAIGLGILLLMLGGMVVGATPD